MDALLLLIPASLLLAVIALAWFLWATHSGQFDDLDTPAVRILFESRPPKPAPPTTPAAASEAPPRSGNSP